MQINNITPSGIYNIYPGFPVEANILSAGYRDIARRLINHRQVIIDGYGGVDWDGFRGRLDCALRDQNIIANWVNAADALRPEAEIDSLIDPFLGGNDPLFGTRFTGQMKDFFDVHKLAYLHPDSNADLNILYGSGASLADWPGFLVYVDIPKNEIQLRSRVGKICNLGASRPDNPKKMYKRFYFVDWIALNRLKADLLPRIDLFVDGQVIEEPVQIAGSDLRVSLTRMSHNYFRVRPWFEPGPWGGQWLKEHIPQLPREASNYAWSFELIVPENGLMLAGDGLMLEFSFDLLMFQEYRSVLGESAERFGVEFPIRFDFLDTFDGGNLSLQCHPRPNYIHENFGEAITQDETYYIVDCKPGARVFLGFVEEIDPQAFQAELERSYTESTPMDVEHYVHTEPAHKHDLFLIPNGTIHCSGANNMVLEISTTPYIFTFKMYDWLRMDLDGQPRPLNIQRAFDNLYFDRKGERIFQEFVSHPRFLRSGNNWELQHLPTHPDHFYDVYRVKFIGSVQLPTNNSCQVMSLVEGETVTLEIPDGLSQCFNYAETFVVPAAAGYFRLINKSETPAMVLMAFIKRPRDINR